MAPPVARAPWATVRGAHLPRNRAQIAVAFHQMRGKNNALVQPLGLAPLARSPRSVVWQLREVRPELATLRCKQRQGAVE